ncbi:type VI secretion system-associated FHA domain protein TagH [Hahella sp. HN01]|uniref:type VI secretion system-associated FHA domain protein TagH n=1 Tax=Hahella sp. HN01 TaxID=2847262 RepID=UPI001C1EE710|nr:type VI secretion system-associated FHA domain protein TagH [Hahella sp. HN01]MBU6955668.1 type VI secretion system-associated FHA domain protein TagH [Hahella sp. HN01]
MQVKLRVVQCPPESEMAGKVVTVEEEGATIGRANSNTWVLPDPNRYVSSVHAKIQFNGSGFEIVDQSTNGTFLNNLSQALVKGQPTPISQGDQILLGPFVLLVEGDKPQDDGESTSITSDIDDIPGGAGAAASPGLDDLDKWLTGVGSEPEPKPSMGRLKGELIGGDTGLTGGDSSVDPLVAIGGSQKSSLYDEGLGLGVSGDEPPADNLLGDSFGLGGGSAESGRMEIPNVIPEDWDKSLIQPRKPETPSTPKAPPPVESKPKPRREPPPKSNPDSLLDIVNTPSEQLAGTDQPHQLPKEIEPIQDLTGAGMSKSDPLESTSPSESSLWGQQPSPAEPSIKEPSGDSGSLADILNDVAPAAEPKSIEKPVEQKPEPDLPIANTGAQAPGKVVPPRRQVEQRPVKRETPPVKQPAMETPREPERPAVSTPPIQVSPEQAAGLAQALGLARLTAEQQANLTPVIADMVRETVDGLMKALRARQTIKNEFRMNLTMIQAAENNPLKFSVSAEDALDNLFTKSGRAYMSPMEATKEAFADISDHQLALFNGIRAAYDYLMSQFNPEKLERRFEKQRGKSLFGGAGKNWEGYKDFFEEMNEDAEKTFKRLFGETFAESYERSFNELKANRQK